ncbi:MAG: NifU family protein, partial [Spirochaetales bacterium]|nr:NifU family protein [Spirochaetales bacterium]
MEKKVVEAIDYVRPSLQNDGGDIDYVRMEGNKVFVKLRGACAGCMMAEMTL